ncbi:tRNA-dihydrouridine(47) synthase [NAD(P)(+)]-like isoform X1 [Diorhabda sublineata]|uniref:tRNA-dihydrouridine(47) synthase [NAD(P)(+)]-like isoform X1 n=1 Tax=Diorhabda sublineata TaxID=1163346 RepID=UPI0024E18E7D|nr:tRNA-dihydrouridine(47) synthase [NAD(P)(+)]-like isoform X1 [Diorhabda sublineata]
MSNSGTCKIKQEYVVSDQKKELNLNHVSEKDRDSMEKSSKEISEPPSKKQKFSKNKLKGQNKARGPTYRVEKSEELCNTLINVIEGEEIPKCERNNCQFLHDISKYLEKKSKDIGDQCYNHEISGKCSRGLTCRFGNTHINHSEGTNKVDQDKFLLYNSNGPYTHNILKHDVQVALRKRTYDFSLAEKCVKYVDYLKKNDKEINNDDQTKTCGAVTDEDLISVLQREKKNIDWKDKLYLSPLTTVGNLPFRRICKEFGANITCGEMAMCSSLLQGSPQEWALLKRHKSEDLFGVQLCANNPHLLAKCGQLLQNETNIDFVDLNMGCPIEMVYKSGAGCGLMRRTKVLESSVRSISTILDVPFTIKMRMGVYNNENIAHTLAPKLKEFGASLLTIHGRSREQRYTKSANWEYIETVAKAVDGLPVFGNGDILSYEDYVKARQTAPSTCGVMIGRGALIKPWIFTEIKEQKLWDISSSERFDIIKKYVNYGLEHWGSDNRGVENTRRFLLEWLSFLYRYIPVGLLETPPQKINERPPLYKGRDELETLMASPSASDWIKISEMLLGPVPDNFHFLPKHKANSYS